MSTDTRHPLARLPEPPSPVVSELEHQVNKWRSQYQSVMNSIRDCKTYMGWESHEPFFEKVRKLKEPTPPVVDGKTPGQVAFEAFALGAKKSRPAFIIPGWDRKPRQPDKPNAGSLAEGVQQALETGNFDDWQHPKEAECEHEIISTRPWPAPGKTLTP